LFWALRGGGGSFGAVIALEFGLLQLPSVYAGTLMWPWEQAGDVLRSWREWLETVPDELTSIGRLVQLPAVDAVPAPLRGRAFATVSAAYAGDAYDGARALAPLRTLRPEVDTFAAMPAAALAGIHGEPEQPTPVRSAHLLLDELPARAVDALVAAAGPGSGSPLVAVDLRHLGGALASAPDGHGALAKVDAAFAAFAVGAAPSPDAAAAVEHHASSAVASLAPWSAFRGYANFANAPSNTRAFFPIEVYQRLQEVKAQYDPEDLFQANHPVRPCSVA
jgi:hypothetical protein